MNNVSLPSSGISGVDIVVLQGAVIPPVNATLLNGATPVNLTGCTVHLLMRDAVNYIALDEPVDIVSAADGTVTYSWKQIDTATAVDLQTRFAVKDGAGNVTFYPDTKYLLTRVLPNAKTRATSIDLFTSEAVGLGASLVGISDVDGYFTSTNVEGALKELAENGGGGPGGGVVDIAAADATVTIGGTTTHPTVGVNTIPENKVIGLTGDLAAINTAIAGKVASVGGTSGRIASSGGTTPQIDLIATGVSAGTYGDATDVSRVTVDAYGRVTSASAVAIQIAESQVTGLTSDLSSKFATSTSLGSDLRGTLPNPTVANLTGVGGVVSTTADVLRATVPGQSFLFETVTNPGGQSGDLLFKTNDSPTGSTIAFQAGIATVEGNDNGGIQLVTANGEQYIFLDGGSGGGIEAINLITQGIINAQASESISIAGANGSSYAIDSSGGVTVTAINEQLSLVGGSSLQITTAGAVAGDVTIQPGFGFSPGQLLLLGAPGGGPDTPAGQITIQTQSSDVPEDAGDIVVESAGSRYDITTVTHSISTGNLNASANNVNLSSFGTMYLIANGSTAHLFADDQVQIASTTGTHVSTRDAGSISGDLTVTTGATVEVGSIAISTGDGDLQSGEIAVTVGASGAANGRNLTLSAGAGGAGYDGGSVHLIGGGNGSWAPAEMFIYGTGSTGTPGGWTVLVGDDGVGTYGLAQISTTNGVAYVNVGPADGGSAGVTLNGGGGQITLSNGTVNVSTADVFYVLADNGFDIQAVNNSSIQTYAGSTLDIIADSTLTLIGQNVYIQPGSGISFWGADPVGQYVATGASGYASVSGSAVKSNDTFTGGIGTTGYTVGDLVALVKMYGLAAT